ncbi:MAG: tetratricopeptide repeat protein, partial [Actinobacteria bacterium]|nr:tetratricopeptide repeat protein [Actinomycetota bacterium]
AFRRGELATARQCLERLARVDFSVSLIPVDVAEVSFRYHAAYGRCLQRAQEYATAISHYAAAATLNSCDAELHLWYVECLLQAGQEAAVEELVERLARDPRAPGLATFIRGTLAMRANEIDAASTFLRAAQAAGYESAPLSFNLGLVAVRHGEVAEAERYYRAALALDPTFMEAHLNLAYLHLMQEQPEAARQAFEHLVALFPECLEARLRLSGLCLQGGELDACLTQLEQLCARLEVGTRAPLTTLEELAELYLTLARRLGARHDLAAAKAASETALLIAPAHAGAHRELGRLCFLRREYHAARQHLEAALRQGCGGDMGSFELLGKTYAALGVPDAAALCYEMEEAGTRRASHP